MKINDTYPGGRALGERWSAARITRAALVAVALLVALAFAAYVALGLASMEQTLNAMRGELVQTNEHVAETNVQLAKMTYLLGSTKSQIRLTNGHLNGMLARLEQTNGLLLTTNGKLSGMGQDLRSTNDTLRRIDAEMEAMTRKITHAKLLF